MGRRSVEINRSGIDDWPVGNYTERMKALAYSTCLGFVVLGVGFCTLDSQAQNFEAGRDRGDVIAAPDSDGKVDVKPSQHSSVVVMMSENGLEIFSPGADPKLGNGEKLLAEPIEQGRQVGDRHFDDKPYGGIRLLGWFF